MPVASPNGPQRSAKEPRSNAESVARGFARLPSEYAIPQTRPGLREAQSWCERLARSHYENFSVATMFLPRGLHQHFYNVYAYCRVSDDLGDEVGDTALSLALLDRWEEELSATYDHLADAAAPGPRHPVFVALAGTISEFRIPQHEFSDLLIAFRQDQRVSRYQTFDDVLSYCRNSANPVGHLVLYLCGYSDAARQKLSDCTCTALQLANFWQDVSSDWERGRIYLPLDDLLRHDVSEQEIAEGRASEAFRALMRFEVERAREWFERGLPLARMVDRRLALDIELFSRGGLAVLEAIERQNFDVLSRRPVVGKARKAGLLLRALAGRLGVRR